MNGRVTDDATNIPGAFNAEAVDTIILRDMYK